MQADTDRLELARLADDGCPNVPDVDDGGSPIRCEAAGPSYAI